MDAKEAGAVYRRLLPLFVAGFLQSFVLWYAIEKPFLNDIGLDAGQIATIVVVLNIVTLIVNVPFGLVADKSSRKGMLMSAGIAMAISNVIGGLSHSFDVYVVAISFFALFNAAYIGGYDSVVYDTLIDECGNADQYGKFYGRLRAVEGVGLALSSLLAGLIAWLFATRDAYFVTAPFALASVVALVFFKEPTFHRDVERADVRKLLSALSALLRNPSSLSVIVTSIVAGAGLSILLQLDQLWMIALNFPTPLYGPFNAFLLIALSFGGFVAGRRQRNMSTEISIVFLALASACALVVDNVYVVMIAQASYICTFTMLTIFLSKRLHDATPSHVRTSVSSATATVGTGLFIATAWAFGVVTKASSVFDAAWIGVGISVAVFVGYLVVLITNRNN